MLFTTIQIKQDQLFVIRGIKLFLFFPVTVYLPTCTDIDLESARSALLLAPIALLKSDPVYMKEKHTLMCGRGAQCGQVDQL